MDKTSAIAREIDIIVDAMRVTLATAAEALAHRSQALADLAVIDPAALQHAVRATAITHVYATMSIKVDAVAGSPEQAEAIVAELEKTEDDGGRKLI